MREVGRIFVRNLPWYKIAMPFSKMKKCVVGISSVTEGEGDPVQSSAILAWVLCFLTYLFF